MGLSKPKTYINTLVLQNAIWIERTMQLLENGEVFGGIAWVEAVVRTKCCSMESCKKNDGHLKIPLEVAPFFCRGVFVLAISRPLMACALVPIKFGVGTPHSVSTKSVFKSYPSIPTWMIFAEVFSALGSARPWPTSHLALFALLRSSREVWCACWFHHCHAWHY